MTPQRPHRSRPGRRWRALALSATAAAAAAVLSACSLLPGGTQGGATTTPQATAVAGAPEDLKPFYSQSVAWSPCEKTFQCAKVKVPLDYAKPDGGSIEIAAIKLPASGQKLGSLLVNPGGPGASGYDFVLQGAASKISQKVRRAYDVIGFDPRGVKRSAPVQCLDDKGQDAYRAKMYDLNSDADMARAKADADAFNAQCKARTGPVLGQVDTISAAKDMDILRATANDAKLNYLGFSYGTFLGATYAELFPKNTGRVVLDGAVDPALGNEELTLGQAAGFEKALRNWTANCLKQSGCPLSGTVDSSIKDIQNLLDSILKHPMRAQDGREVTANMFVSGLIVPLYDTATWSLLEQALGDALKGDPTAMLALSDFSADRDENGHYTSNSNEAFTAIGCLDYPSVSDLAVLRKDQKELMKASPTLGYYLAGNNCQDWPYPPKSKPHRITAAGSAPIVVVGTSDDPATPYPWAVSLRNQLASGVLVSWKGDGHTAYGRSNTCVDNAVDGYLVDGKVPADKTQC
ncbi:alpha/beta hydrolase [Paenarthrobacter sp. DKR-5]|uniref:alpha/beta hydrolase n=1 Tax=Paenarthrobacter sp. DKR-5 TaxID=2835535 RepID=UPI001BDCF35C|nr:alpha/beta hydrolase [Paenarthrobacter sp. DKR-5]MBT1003613.1 alpha/beta hydrolase [Paenarthrobacter sp. DKR-5]